MSANELAVDIIWSRTNSLNGKCFTFRFRFDDKESVSGVQQLKSSVQKGIRAKLLESYPHLEGYIDEVFPKKDAFRIVKW